MSKNELMMQQLQNQCFKSLESLGNKLVEDLYSHPLQNQNFNAPKNHPHTCICDNCLDMMAEEIISNDKKSK